MIVAAMIVAAVSSIATFIVWRAQRRVNVMRRLTAARLAAVTLEAAVMETVSIAAEALRCSRVSAGITHGNGSTSLIRYAGGRCDAQSAIRRTAEPPPKAILIEGHGYITFEDGIRDRMLRNTAARWMGARLDLFDNLEQRTNDAVQEAAKRIGRDLHDGPLQSLIGSGIHLETLWKRGAASADDLAIAHQAVESGQRDLRELVAGLRPSSGRSVEESRLTTRFSLLAAQVRHQWGVDVDIRASELQNTLSRRERREFRNLIREAVINAAKHARPSRVEVDVSRMEQRIRLTIRDDGCGFDFEGRKNLTELQAESRGPLSVVERVAALGGELTIQSTRNGSELQIDIPLVS